VWCLPGHTLCNRHRGPGSVGAPYRATTGWCSPGVSLYAMYILVDRSYWLSRPAGQVGSSSCSRCCVHFQRSHLTAHGNARSSKSRCRGASFTTLTALLQSVMDRGLGSQTRAQACSATMPGAEDVPWFGRLFPTGTATGYPRTECPAGSHGDGEESVGIPLGSAETGWAAPHVCFPLVFRLGHFLVQPHFSDGSLGLGSHLDTKLGCFPTEVTGGWWPSQTLREKTRVLCRCQRCARFQIVLKRDSCTMCSDGKSQHGTAQQGSVPWLQSDVPDPGRASSLVQASRHQDLSGGAAQNVGRHGF